MQDRPIDKVLEQLEDYTERGDEIRARCPAHNGTSEDSLSIREAENGDVLLHCHAECENEDIVEALDLELADLFSKNGKASKPLTKEAQPAEVRTVDELPGVIGDYFTFEDEEGKLFYIQQHKGAFYRVVGEDEDGDPFLITGLGGVEPVLFELPGLIQAVEAVVTIYHLEGCKDVVNAKERLGISATTSGGAKTWKGEFAEHYRGAKEVVILPDNDEEGAAYAQKVAQDLLGVAETIKIVDLPGLPEKGDLTDWLDAGHTAEEFFEVVATSPAMDASYTWPEKPDPLEIRLPAVEEFDERGVRRGAAPGALEALGAGRGQEDGQRRPRLRRRRGGRPGRGPLGQEGRHLPQAPRRLVGGAQPLGWAGGPSLQHEDPGPGAGHKAHQEAGRPGQGGL